MTHSARHALPRLHVVLPDPVLTARPFATSLAPILEAGGPLLAVHVRGRQTTGRVIHDRARDLVEIAADTGTVVFVNDRVDIAVAVKAHGVHLREDSLSVADARRLAGEGVRVGRSIHQPEQAATEPAEGLDYFVLGSIFPTDTHPGGASVGVETLERAVQASATPVLAIGGISQSRVAEVIGVGAYGVAVMSGVLAADDPASAVSAYLDRLAACRSTAE